MGGAESNVLVAVSQLGWRCGWVGRLPDTALGDLVLRVLRRACDALVATPDADCSRLAFPVTPRPGNFAPGR